MLGVAAAYVVGAAMMCFSVCMAHIFCRSRRRRWQTVLAWMLCALVCIPLGEALRPVVGNCSGQFTGFLAVFVYLYLFDVPVKQRFFTYFFVDSSMYLTAVLARYTVLLFHGLRPDFNPRIAFVAVYFVLTAAYVLLFFRVLRDLMVERLAQFEEHLGSLAAFACVGYVLMLLLFDAWQIRDAVSPGEYLRLLLYVVLLSCGYWLSFYTMTAVKEGVLAQAQVRELTAQVRQSEQYYVTLTSHIQEVRQIQHDSRHHLRVLDGYLRDGEYGRLRGYLAELMEQAPDTGSLIYCANYTANILLGFYGEQARSDGIDFRYDAQIPAELCCSPVDICAVLGNALQNALDACVRQAPGEARYLSLLARMVGPNLTLEIKNSYDGVAVEAGGKLLTRKDEPGHGLGLASIERVAAQYHGYCSATRTEREFTLRVVLTMGT